MVALLNRFMTPTSAIISRDQRTVEMGRLSYLCRGLKRPLKNITCDITVY